MADETYNDSNIPGGAPVITIVATGVTYDCDSDADIPLDKVKVIKRYKANGAAGGSRGLKDFVEFPLTIQLATSATAEVRAGQTFTTSKTGDRVFIITDASHRFSKEAYDVQQINCIEKLN